MNEPPAAASNSYAVPSHRLSIPAFRKIQQLAYDLFGIYLNEQKRTLVEGRLQEYLTQRGYTGFDGLIHDLEAGGDLTLLSDLANRLTTNHTYFYRESQHFDYLARRGAELLVDVMRQQGDTELRIWCAGCSKGDEPYTLGIVLTEAFKAYGNVPWSILATDISTSALEEAKAGVYHQERLSRLPPLWKVSYFQHAGGERWRISPQLASRVTFRRFNLMNARFPFKQPFHLILCRNVMIYFDPPTCHGLVRRFYDSLFAGGLFVCGLSEALPRQDCPFELVAPSIYRKPRLLR